MLPEKLKTWIKSVQPCFATESNELIIKQAAILLGVIHEFARKDRHRRLTIFAAQASEITGEFIFDRPVKLDWIEGCPCNLFESEGILGKFRFAEYVAGLDVDLDAKATMDVVVGDFPMTGKEFSSLPDNLGHVVEYTIGYFEDAFGVK
jgi:hypothetical protein